MILIGGASRSGKGIVANELMLKTGLPHLSLDPIKMALARAVPSYPLDTNAGSIETSQQLWPFVSTLIKNLHETHVPTIVEGELLPCHVDELRTTTKVNFKACFVGYALLSVDEKINQVRSNQGHANDWSADLSDAQLRVLIHEGIEFSRFLEGECLAYHIPYIDFSQNFEQAKNKVISLLCS